jgi:hypothetical protein
MFLVPWFHLTGFYQRVCSFETVKFRSNGELATNICRLAEEDKASTVIAGSRGLGLYDRVMLGTSNLTRSWPHMLCLPVVVISSCRVGEHCAPKPLPLLSHDCSRGLVSCGKWYLP